ncbi:MAG: hypothetical protein MRY72_07785 [Aquisalinus sp.]|nr:hypothetical protein [Aquisalinus sp.]
MPEIQVGMSRQSAYMQDVSRQLPRHSGGKQGRKISGPEHELYSRLEKTMIWPEQGEQ